MENINNKKISLLKKRFKSNPRMLKVIEKCEEKYGDKAIYYLPFGGGVQTIVYPSILFPNGTLTQTATSIGGTGVVALGTPRYIGSKNYNMGIQMSFSGSSNSPALVLCIFTQSTNSGNPINLNSMNGLGLNLSPGIGSGSSVTSITLYNGTSNSGTLGSTSLQAFVYIKELNGRLNIAYGTSTPTYVVTNYDSSSYFNGDSRYLHLYQSDGGVTSTSFTITQVASII